MTCQQHSNFWNFDEFMVFSFQTLSDRFFFPTSRFFSWKKTGFFSMVFFNGFFSMTFFAQFFSKLILLINIQQDMISSFSSHSSIHIDTSSWKTEILTKMKWTRKDTVLILLGLTLKSIWALWWLCLTQPDFHVSFMMAINAITLHLKRVVVCNAKNVLWKEIWKH